MHLHSSLHELVGKLADQTANLHQLLQDPVLDSLAFAQHEQLVAKLRTADFGAVRQVFVGAHLQHARPTVSGRRYTPLASNFLDAPPTQIAPGSIFLLLNNDIGPDLARYIAFRQAHPQALFVVWDWDSQHWLQMSTTLAMHSDVYVAATSENAFLLSHFNPHILGPVFVGVHQWSREFLFERFDLLRGPRADTPFGPHVHYAKYPKRSRAVAALAQHYDTVRFADNQYKAKSDEDNLREWAAYKSHWIVPVLGGVPIRAFNAMVTGGIPIVPSFYRNLPEVASLGQSALFYEVHDLLAPQAIQALAVERFASEGSGALLQRVTDALALHHVDARCTQLLGLLQEKVAALLGGRGASVPGYYRGSAFAP
jgi:hypothetical protein